MKGIVSPIHKTASAIWAWFGKRRNWSAWAMVIVTLGILWYAKVQSGVAVQQASILRQQTEILRSAQRASVGPVDISRPEIRPGLRPRISIPLANSGRTPANTVTAQFGAKIGPCTETCDKPFKADYTGNADAVPQGIAVIQPNARHSLNCIRTEPFSEKEVAGITSGTMFFVVYGRIKYADASGPDRETKFAYRWVPDFSTWRACGNYNTAK